MYKCYALSVNLDNPWIVQCPGQKHGLSTPKHGFMLCEGNTWIVLSPSPKSFAQSMESARQLMYCPLKA